MTGDDLGRDPRTMSRETDLPGSKEAAHAIEGSGEASAERSAYLILVRHFPGRTSRELDGLRADRRELGAHRRLPELRERMLVFSVLPGGKGPQRWYAEPVDWQLFTRRDVIVRGPQERREGAALRQIERTEHHDHEVRSCPHCRDIFELGRQEGIAECARTHQQPGLFDRGTS